MAARHYPPIEERLWSRVRHSGSCWEFTGARASGDGYGFIGYMGKSIRAHRVAYELTNGPIPIGMVVMHTCDNPPCINPAHLALGTQRDNMADAVSKHRMVSVPGERNGFARLTDRTVVDLRRRAALGESIPRLAAEIGVHPDTARLAVRGRTWSHVTEALPWDPAESARLDEEAVA